MRKNFPITEIEYPVSDETLIVSRTDLKGKLTSVSYTHLTLPTKA